MESSTNDPEADFRKLHQQLRNGRITIDSFLEALGFEKWLRDCVYRRYDFTVFEGSYEPEDLIVDSRLKIRSAAPQLDPQTNAHHFLGWLKVVVHHTYLNALRKHNKPGRYGWTRTDEPLEGIPAPDEDFDGKYFLHRFLEFIKTYRPERQIAILLWLLDGYSYREVEEALLEQGIKRSHTTVRRWVAESLDDFRKSLGLPLSEELLKMAGGARPPIINVTRGRSHARRTPAETLAGIAALPLEGASDLFSGRDHDSVLYLRK
jgi:DNA-directed RNA polymerase specialized sigma24 family protein